MNNLQRYIELNSPIGLFDIRFIVQNENFKQFLSEVELKKRLEIINRFISRINEENAEVEGENDNSNIILTIKDKDKDKLNIPIESELKNILTGEKGKSFLLNRLESISNSYSRLIKILNNENELKFYEKPKSKVPTKESLKFRAMNQIDLEEFTKNLRPTY